MMDRLTFITTKNTVALKGKSCNYGANSYSCQVKDGIEKLDDALEKLAHYEDMEEQGKMLIIPCKPGDTVYFLENVNYTKKIGVNEVVTARVIGICSSSNEEGEKIWCMRLFMLHGEYLIPFDKFGKIVFATEQKAKEAKEALEGMENGD